MMKKCRMTVLMSMVLAGLFMAGTCGMTHAENDAEYVPEWESLDNRPLPQWFDDVKLGMFIHWGPYSEPSCQPHRHEYMKPADLTAEKFDAAEWVRIAKQSGFKYITFTAKHGGGYAMYNSKYTNWDSYQTGPQRDFLKELSAACEKENMRLIVYYCKDDMFLPTDAPMIHPFGIEFPDLLDEIVEKYGMEKVTDNWVDYFQGQIREIAANYPIDGFWFDGVRLPSTYVKTKQLLADLYNQYPDIVVNDRVGTSFERKKHGDFFTYERGWLKPVHIIPHKWERAEKLSHGWWYHGEDKIAEDLDTEELLWHIIDVVSLGGNYSVGIGPRPDGTIPQQDIDHMKQIGDWLDVNGEAVYGTQPWIWGYYRDGEDMRYTMDREGDTIYAFIRGWPGEKVVFDKFTGGLGVVLSMEWLATGEKLEQLGRGAVKLPKERPAGIPVYVIKVEILRDGVTGREGDDS